MKLRTALLLLLPASGLGACHTFLLPHPSDQPDRASWSELRWDEGDHVPVGFRDPPPPPPPPPPPKE
jgi:hypothetical protein